MATFWERATGFGDGASAVLDLDVLQAVIVLRMPDLITVTHSKQWLGLTTEQGAELDEILDRVPGNEVDALSFAARLRAAFLAARAGMPEFDSVENVMLALGFDPPQPG